MSTKTLTPKQTRFIQEYMLDLNATQAAIRSGYAKNGAEVTGSRLLRNPKLAEALASAKKERAESLKIDADWVLKELVSLYYKCIGDTKPLLQSRSKKHLRDGAGNALYTFNAGGAARALELIGKHVDVQSFKDRVEHDVGMSLIERLQAGRDRASQQRTEDIETVDVTPAELPAPH